MFTRFKKERKRLFLDPMSKEKFEHSPAEMVEVILSPSLYWVKKMKLPIKNAREAKKLLPSIFEDMLPEGSYSYHAYKSGEEFFLFAYEEKKIFESLHKKGVVYAQIASVHFAQSLSSFLETPKSINEKQVLLLQEELVLLAPLAWVEQSEPLSIEGIKLSNNTIKLQQFGHIVDSSSLYKIGIALAFLALIVSAEIFIAMAKKEEISSLKEDVFARYKLQSTLMQNRSSLEKYTKINAEQKKLRTTIATFLSLKLLKEQKLLRLEYKNKNLYVTISNVTQQDMASIKKELQKKALIFSENLSKSNLKIEVKI